MHEAMGMAARQVARLADGYNVVWKAGHMGGQIRGGTPGFECLNAHEMLLLVFYGFITIPTTGSNPWKYRTDFFQTLEKVKY